MKDARQKDEKNEVKRPRKKKKVIIEETDVKEMKKEEQKLENDSMDLEPREIIVEKQVGFNLIEVVLIMIITLLFGGLIGAIITYTVKEKQDANVVEQVPTDLQEFVDVYETIQEEYYEGVDKSALLDAGIKGMIDYLGDPYSNYLSDDETTAFNQKLNGTYIGIGAEVTKYADGRIEFSNPFPNSSAANAGILPGDVLLKIDGKDVSDLQLNDIAKLLKGDENTTVEVTYAHDGVEKTVTLTRSKVEIPSVHSDIVIKNEQKIGVITIDVFALNTYSQFEQALLDLEKEQIESLVIDVRNNSGGHLDVVTKSASLFLEKGKIVYQLETKGVKEPIYAEESNIHRTYPIAVVINHDSASASEILAAALQESYGATVVGVPSYGKGTVQRAQQLSSGATIKYTIQQWLTPNGNSVNEIGVTPDENVEQGEEYLQEATVENDTQLQKAFDVVSKK